MLSTVKAYAALAGLLVVVVLCVACFFWGRSTASAKCALATSKTELAAVRESANRTEAAQSAAAEAATDSAERHTVIQTQFVPIDREVIRYVQTPVAATTCLDADGLHIWSTANRGEDPDPGTPSAGYASLWATSAAYLGPLWRSAFESRSGSEAVPRMQSAASGPGGLHQPGQSLSGVSR